MSTILIAVDGSDSDRSVVRQALDLLGPDRHYVVVNVDDEPAIVGAASVSYAAAAAFSVPELSRFADGLDAEADHATDIATAAAAALGLPDVEALGEVGDPASILVALSADRNVDAIVIGQSRRGWFSTFFDPSVEEAVVHRATCPVIVMYTDS